MQFVLQLTQSNKLKGFKYICISLYKIKIHDQQLNYLPVEEKKKNLLMALPLRLLQTEVDDNTSIPPSLVSWGYRLMHFIKARH